MMEIISSNEKESNPMEFGELVESTSCILNQLMAYTGREEEKELEKREPDGERIRALQGLFEEVHAIDNDPKNFEDPDRMEEIIRTYGELLNRERLI